jgi:predicted lysophospholipase L1 biosynthesis ABC-type transport system permease subunit
LFEDTLPLGRHFQLLTGARQHTPMEIVGIVRDARYSSVDEPATPTFYLPATQLPPMANTFAVRAALEPARITPLVRELVTRVAPGVALLNITTQQQQSANTLTGPRALAMATSLATLVVVVLACLGIFAVVSYDVAQRTREFGIRLALGARRAGILRLVLKDVAIVTVIGAGLGVAVAANVTALLADALFGVTPTDIPTLAGSVGALSVVAILAALWPARRAARLCPTQALRHE